MAVECVQLPGDLLTFLRGETDARNFRHADHVRMGFEILTRHADFLEAATAYSRALKAMSARAGNPGAYHETVTLAFLSLIAERIASCAYDDFAQFARLNADLLDKQALSRWYAAERLQSPTARSTFLLPAERVR